MCRIDRRAFAEMKNFPARKISFVIARTQPERTVRLPRLIHVNDGDQHAAGGNAALGGLKQIPLQVIANRDQVPVATLNLEFILLQIGNDSIYLQTALNRAAAQMVNRRLRPVHSRDIPAMFREP